MSIDQLKERKRYKSGATLRIDLEILSLASNGATQREIAQKLGLKKSLLTSSINSIQYEFGARTFIEAVAMALRNKLIA